MRRVAITGLGAITPAGLDVATSWARLVAGETAIEPLRIKWLAESQVPLAAHVTGFEPSAHFNYKKTSSLDRVSQLAVVAARQAVADSGLVFTPALADAAAVIIGVAAGGMTTLDDGFFSVYRENRPRLHPLTIPRMMTSAPASQISMDLGLRGLTYVIASACASGTHAIGTAFRAIRSGETKVAITGGAEACVTFGTLMGWQALGVLTYDMCRPFSKDRSGIVLGEGAAMMVLEDIDHARDRGARIYAEIAGFGANADAGGLTSLDVENAARAMRMALVDANMAPDEVSYVNAHGTGTVMNDAGEGAVIRSVFEGAAPPPVSSIKAVMGHSLGAAGAIEAMATALSLHHEVIPPTANCTDPDLSIGIDMVPNQARVGVLGAALTNSFAFGGLNAVLALRRYNAGAAAS